jgi:hypothetical protein
MTPTIDIKRGDHGPHVRQFQTDIDRELKEHGFPWRKITIDGSAGEHTFDAANMVAYIKGFSSDELHKIGKQQKISHRDVEILEGHFARTQPMKHRAHAREDDLKKLREAHRHPELKPIPGSHYKCWFDDHEVPIWLAEVLTRARASGMWKGVVFSGVRTPQHSEELCIAMCGAPSCPGRCAGRVSNHACPPSGEGKPFEGAVDVTDYVGLREYCRAHNEPLRGGGEVLPADLPHFSHEGN